MRVLMIICALVHCLLMVFSPFPLIFDSTVIEIFGMIDLALYGLCGMLISISCSLYYKKPYYKIMQYELKEYRKGKKKKAINDVFPECIVNFDIFLKMLPWFIFSIVLAFFIRFLLTID